MDSVTELAAKAFVLTLNCRLLFAPALPSRALAAKAAWGLSRLWHAVAASSTAIVDRETQPGQCFVVIPPIAKSYWK
jgi:hypothetical protein